MAGTLLVVFRSRVRLLPLALALGAAALSYGAVSVAGGSLTMASIAALPVLIGLAVDYAIQFQARFDERIAETAELPPPEVAARDAAMVGGPTIAAAGLSTAVGFLVLLLSPVPMVRGFAVVLVVGIAFALICALTAGFAALTLYWRARAAARRAAAHAAAALRARSRRIGSAHRRSRPGRFVARGGGPRPRPRASARWTARWLTKAGAGHRPGAGHAGLGGRHPDRGDLRRPRPRAPGPSRAPGRERAPARDRRVGRDRRDRARRRTSRRPRRCDG